MAIETLHDLNCEVFVAGGGAAGLPCALAAARNGAKVILCQNRPVLGGNASSEVRMHIVGADAGGKRGMPLATEIREGGIIEEVRLDCCVRNPQRSASMLDLIFYEKVRAEPNLTLLLNSTLTKAEVENGQINFVMVERQSTEDLFKINAKIYVDCTGDGRLGVEAGNRFRHGHEARDEYQEPLAQEKADSYTQGSSLLFQARETGSPKKFIPPNWIRKFTEEDLKFRPHHGSGVDLGLEYGFWWVEWGGTLDTIKDNETIRDELLAIMLGVWDHIKNGGDHGAENWALDWFGFLPGKRESRRFEGQYKLVEQDLTESRSFNDRIAYGGWSLDRHPSEGIYAKNEKPCDQPFSDYIYDIPLRSCISNSLENLMFAGRNISATHIAFSSTRVMATCGVIGQGVGTAAAIAARQKVPAAKIAKKLDLIKTIQQTLLKDSVYLIGMINEDPNDLARKASIHTSSEQDEGPANLVISGQTRSVHGHMGAPPDRSIHGSNRWMSVPKDGFPVEINLEWKESVSLKEIRLVFDTGMHRALTLSHSDGYVKKMIWGEAQPETIRDYSIEFINGNNTVHSIQIKDNYQRLCIHQLEKIIQVESIKIIIEATNGLDHARIFEIRAYGDHN